MLIILPVLQSQAVSLVRFGVLVVKLLEIGMITPPTGIGSVRVPSYRLRCGCRPRPAARGPVAGRRSASRPTFAAPSLQRRTDGRGTASGSRSVRGDMPAREPRVRVQPDSAPRGHRRRDEHGCDLPHHGRPVPPQGRQPDRETAFPSHERGRVRLFGTRPRRRIIAVSARKLEPACRLRDACRGPRMGASFYRGSSDLLPVEMEEVAKGGACGRGRCQAGAVPIRPARRCRSWRRASTTSSPRGLAQLGPGARPSLCAAIRIAGPRRAADMAQVRHSSPPTQRSRSPATGGGAARAAGPSRDPTGKPEEQLRSRRIPSRGRGASQPATRPAPSLPPAHAPMRPCGVPWAASASLGPDPRRIRVRLGQPGRGVRMIRGQTDLAGLGRRGAAQGDRRTGCSTGRASKSGRSSFHASAMSTGYRDHAGMQSGRPLRFLHGASNPPFAARGTDPEFPPSGRLGAVAEPRTPMAVPVKGPSAAIPRRRRASGFARISDPGAGGGHRPPETAPLASCRSPT